MANKSPTELSLAHLRKGGYHTTVYGELVGASQVVEHWIPKVKKRRDLFGFIDIVAVRIDVLGVLGVQTTSASHLAARIKKAHLSDRDWEKT